MALFLRKLEIKPEKNPFAKENASRTHLIDRFFMIVLGISKWEEYEKLSMNSDELENAFIELMKLFLPDPKKGFILKLRKFLSL